MTSLDPRNIVRAGYDRVAERYAQWSQAIYSPERDRVIRLLLDTLPPGAKVLDLGCGNGVPTAQRLAERFEVTGVDISGEQLARARRNVPGAAFIQADMTEVELPAGSFDAVVAMYSIFHLPCEEHMRVFQNIYGWLRPGGIFAFSTGTRDEYRGYEEQWLGEAPMFWSNYGPGTTRKLLIGTGFEIESLRVETISEEGEAASFVWFVCHKTAAEVR